MTRSARILPVLSAVLCLLSLLVVRLHAENRGEWRSYGADKASSKYAPRTQFTHANVSQLRLAWRWRSPDQPIREARPSLWTMAYEATPLMVGGILYTSTSLSQVVAIDAAGLQCTA